MNTKILSLNDLYESKTYVRESGGFDFKHAKEYVAPFIEKITNRISDATFDITAVTGAINKDEDTQALNVSYGRFLVTAHLPPAYETEEAFSKIGMIVALDNQKPVMKVFSGKDVKACMNLTIFNADHLLTQDLTANIGSIYNKADDYAIKVGDELNDFRKKVELLKAMTFKGESLHEIIGKLIEYSLRQPKLGQTPILSGTKELYDTKSKYSLKEGAVSGWTYYNSITEAIKKADISDQALKTILLSRAFLPKEVLNN